MPEVRRKHCTWIVSRLLVSPWGKWDKSYKVCELHPLQDLPYLDILKNIKIQRVQTVITNPDKSAPPIFPMKNVQNKWVNEMDKKDRRVTMRDLNLEFDEEQYSEEGCVTDEEEWKDGDKILKLARDEQMKKVYQDLMLLIQLLLIIKTFY